MSSIAIHHHSHVHSHSKTNQGHAANKQNGQDPTDDLQSLITQIIQALKQAGVDVNANTNSGDDGATDSGGGTKGASKSVGATGGSEKVGGKGHQSGLMDKLQNLLQALQEVLAADPSQSNKTAAGVADSLSSGLQKKLSDMGLGDASQQTHHHLPHTAQAA